MYGQKAFSYIALLLCNSLPEGYKELLSSKQKTKRTTLRKSRRRYASAHLDGLQHCRRKPTATSVTEFCYKSVNLFIEELVNIKVILFSNT